MFRKHNFHWLSRRNLADYGQHWLWEHSREGSGIPPILHNHNPSHQTMLRAALGTWNFKPLSSSGGSREKYLCSLRPIEMETMDEWGKRQKDLWWDLPCQSLRPAYPIFVHNANTSLNISFFLACFFATKITVLIKSEYLNLYAQPEYTLASRNNSIKVMIRSW